MDTLNLIIVDDHPLYRFGTQSVIKKQLPKVNILAEYGSGEELLVYLQGGVLPDIVLLDVMMPGIGGIKTAQTIKEKYPDIKIIMLSSEIDPETINKLLDIGVNGYLSKLVVKEDLAHAMLSVVEGNLFYGQDIARIIYDACIAKTNSLSSTDKEEENTTTNDRVYLTKREEEIIALLCNGLATKEIAEELCISKRTIDNHKANIMQKMGFHSTVELVKYAIKEGIVIL